ncbi:hypothetical protein EV180_006050, partial [Coemansia sp. RSA 518]
SLRQTSAMKQNCPLPTRSKLYVHTVHRRCLTKSRCGRRRAGIQYATRAWMLLQARRVHARRAKSALLKNRLFGYTC